MHPLVRNLALILVGACFAVTAALGQFGGNGAITNTSTATNTSRVLCSIRAANFNTTADQACNVPGTITAWVPLSIIVTNCAGTMTLAVGGVYPAASKAGTALVANTQVYSALSGASIVLLTPLAANIATTRYTINTVYLALTTGAGGAATCDFYVVGTDLT